MERIMNWFKENWPKATIFLAVYVTLLLILFVRKENYVLYLIWLQTPIYFFHEFEEYVFPGGFLKFFNRKMFKSPEDEFPLDKSASFYINVPIIFIAFPVSAILATKVSLSFGVWTAAFSFFNAFSHIIMAIRFKYNPGLIVSVLVNIPIGAYTLYYFYSRHIVQISTIMVGCVIGLLVQGIITVYGFKILKPKILKKKYA